MTGFRHWHSFFLKFDHVTNRFSRCWSWNHFFLISAIFIWETLGAVIMPDRPIRGQWRYPRKMERHFPTNPANQEEWFLPFFVRFPNSLPKWREVGRRTVLSKWNGKFQLQNSDQDIRDHFEECSRIFRSEGPDTDLPIWLPTEISEIFGLMESIRSDIVESCWSQKHWVLPLCQTDRSEISGNTWGDCNDIFRWNWANQ